MKDDTSIIPLRQPGSVEDPLTGIGGEGAHRMLLTALEAEIEAFLDGSPKSGLWMVGSASFGTGADPSGGPDRDRRPRAPAPEGP